LQPSHRARSNTHPANESHASEKLFGNWPVRLLRNVALSRKASQLSQPSPTGVYHCGQHRTDATLTRPHGQRGKSNVHFHWGFHAEQSSPMCHGVGIFSYFIYVPRNRLRTAVVACHPRGMVGVSRGCWRSWTRIPTTMGGIMIWRLPSGIRYFQSVRETTLSEGCMHVDDTMPRLVRVCGIWTPDTSHRLARSWHEVDDAGQLLSPEGPTKPSIW
jgi:hypothetical protein